MLPGAGMQAPQQAGGAPPSGGMPQSPQPNAGAPSAAPMMTPQSPEGDIAGARMGVALAVKVLQRVAAQVPGQMKTPIVQCIAQLTKAFGPFDPRISDSQLTALIARSKGPGNPGNTPTPPPQGAPAGAHPKRAAPQPGQQE